jgi:hypothetical protein
MLRNVPGSVQVLAVVSLQSTILTGESVEGFVLTVIVGFPPLAVTWTSV